MPRGKKTRDNMKIGTFEKKYGLPPEVMRIKKSKDIKLNISRDKDNV